MSKRDIKFIVSLFLIWRILLFIPLYFGHLLIPIRTGYQYMGNLNYLLSSWANFDGIHYLKIAQVGYTQDSRFFPLYPLLIKLLSNFFGAFWGASLISNLSFLLSLLFFYKLIRLDFSIKVARLAVVFLLLFPTSFFFVSIYSESLFLLLLLLAIYLARKRSWIWAGLAGSLIASTRLVGIFILPTLFFEFFAKTTIKTDFFKKILALLLVPLGILVYAYFNLQKWGQPFYFITAQGELQNGRSVSSVVLFPQTIFRYIKILTTTSTGYFEWWIALLEIATFIFVGLMLFIGWRKQVRASYLVFSLGAFLLPSLSGTFTALPRYVAVIFLIFMTMALLKSKLFKIVYLLASSILLFILLMFFSRGYFIA